MMKQYDFPRIFQNVVGEVIPLSLRNRQAGQRRALDFPGRLQEMSSSCNSSSNRPGRQGPLYVQSKKKKLVRRLKFNKTSSCFSAKQGQREEDKLSQNGNTENLRNFLKRKQLTLQKTDKPSSRLEKDEIFEKTGTLDEEDEIRSNLAQAVSNRNTNLRLRTSFEHHNVFDKEKAVDTDKQFKHRTSQANALPTHYGESHFTVRSKPKHKTFFKYELISEEKSHSRIESRNSGRKKSKKKTVNFVIQSEKENQEGDNLCTDSPRKGTKVQRTFVHKSSKFNGISKEPTPHSRSKLDYSDEEMSNWSARSVVSIKFTSTRNFNSKHTVRSQLSIFEDNSRFMIKHTDSASRYRTKTYIKFPHEKLTSMKNYKSLTSLSEVSIDLRSDWSIAKSRRRQDRPNTNKSLASSKKLVEKKGKMHSKVSILIKSNDPYLFSGSQRNVDQIRSSNFQELVFKKTNTVFKAARNATDPDVYAELNNFHKFLNDSSIEDSDHEGQRLLTKPMVIDSSTGHRAIYNSRLQNEQNLMIDMGLTLLKKMSILRQKKM